VDSVKATRLIKQTLEKDPPYGASVTFESGEDPANGWESPKLAEWLQQSIQQSSNTFYKKPAMLFGEGGSIPFMQMLGEQFPGAFQQTNQCLLYHYSHGALYHRVEAQFVITGVLGPGSNAHGPNEFLHIGKLSRHGSCCTGQKVHVCLFFYLSDMAKNVTCCVAHILHDFNRAKSQ
jgi:hypothetical protein